MYQQNRENLDLQVLLDTLKIIFEAQLCLSKQSLIILFIIITINLDPVKKCLRALEAAQTDTEKFATLFLVPKLVKGVDCDKNARLHLMKVKNP